MTTRKPQNSILVLATLGVYLGLVLIGATPQVLAQAAMTKQFNVKDEIEVKDDLDKKPDDCEKLAAKAKEKQQRVSVDSNAFISYAKAFTAVSSTARQLDPTYLSLRSQSFTDSRHPNWVEVNFDGKPFLSLGETKRKLEGEILVLSHVFPSVVLDQKGFGFELTLDNSGLKATAKLLRNNDEEAHEAFIAYDSTLDLWRCTAKTQTDLLISKNTEVSWVNNQVLIITNLPRAGLDALLAKDAK